MDKHGPVLGASLYSFTNEWQQRTYTLEQMVARVAELGLGPGVEVVGFQSFREYPDVSDEFARRFRSLLDRHGLIPTCLGGNVDMGRRKDRLMSVDEMTTYVERQITSAKKLGFPVLRIQISVGPQFMEKIVPIAEGAGVHVACELHSPLSVDNPEVVEMRACYDRISSPYLGFVPDFSTTMTNVPEGYWGNLRRHGAPEGLIDAAKDIWKTDKPTREKFAALAEAGGRFGGGEGMSGQLSLAMTMFGHMPVQGWTELIPYARHIHGKFYEVDASGTETSIPYPEIMALLKKVGYQGTISAEWEGQAFTEDPIGFEQVQAWHAMCSRLLAG